ncbi:MAG TPA: biopolymer transporter ExbD [bacterium (Candidatus Stahlbacteria)]|nr:biopolymer transporter ExbD [Candidatus Stahlbacteria bacterium]
MKPLFAINIIPMACVGLLLVVMMILVAPMVMTHTRTQVNVPIAHTAETQTEESITITFAKDGSLYLNDHPATVDGVAGFLDSSLAVDPFQLVIVRADKEVYHQDVLDILALLKKHGAKRMACATKKPKGE